MMQRLLGEAMAPALAEKPAQQSPPPLRDEETPVTEPAAEPATANATSPSIKQLAQQWQSGDHLGVATALMFTAASYKDFVSLIYVIGRDSGLQLGALLDELADAENVPEPKTPPQYRSALARAAGGEEEGVL